MLPWFAVAFAALVALNSTGWLPAFVASAGSDLSRWFLVAAIAGLGMKTQLRELAAVGLKPVRLGSIKCQIFEMNTHISNPNSGLFFL